MPTRGFLIKTGYSKQYVSSNLMDGGEMDDKVEVGLLKKAELLIALKGYRKESSKQSEKTVDIKVSKPDSDETALIRVVSDLVDIAKAKEMKEILEEPDISEIIVFGERFTSAARRDLREEEIEFFSTEQNIVSTLNPWELTSRIYECVDDLCRIKCGHVPESESECKGFTKDPVRCSHCGGSGKIEDSYRERRCPICHGIGSMQNHYLCRVRLISDNADFHNERGWITLLQNDLTYLLEILLEIKLEDGEILLGSPNYNQ